MPRTFPTQISQMADQRMHQLSAVIGKAKRRMEKFKIVHDTAWNEAFEILEELNTNEGTKFIARDGYTIQKQKRQGAPVLDEEALHAAMLAAYGDDQKWLEITAPTLNPMYSDSNLLGSKLLALLGRENFEIVWPQLCERRVVAPVLATMARNDVNLRQMAQDALNTPDPTYARVRPEWSRDDEQRSAIFGIFKIPEVDVEEIVIPVAEYNALLAGNHAPQVVEPPAPTEWRDILPDVMRVVHEAIRARLAPEQITPELISSFLSEVSPAVPPPPAPVPAPGQPVRRGPGRPRRNPVAQ
jgi:L-rhamnose mutarotase